MLQIFDISLCIKQFIIYINIITGIHCKCFPHKKCRKSPCNKGYPAKCTYMWQGKLVTSYPCQTCKEVWNQFLQGKSLYIFWGNSSNYRPKFMYFLYIIRLEFTGKSPQILPSKIFAVAAIFLCSFILFSRKFKLCQSHLICTYFLNHQKEKI